jgi:hypothetical protein
VPCTILRINDNYFPTHQLFSLRNGEAMNF